MSLVIEKQSSSIPSFFHREYENDFGKIDPKSSSKVEQCLRVAKVSLPFIGLYQPVGQYLAIGLGIVRTINCLSQLRNAVLKKNKIEIGSTMLQTAVTVVSVAYSIVAYPKGMIISTGHDLAINCGHLVKACKEHDYKKALENGSRALSNVVYLGVLVSGSLEIVIASLAVQTLLGLYDSRTEFKKGNYLEGTAHLLMGIIRAHQLHACVKIRNSAAIQKLLVDAKNTIIIPNNSRLAYENGSTILYAYYPACYTATAIEGNYYGLQNTFNYSGQLTYTNPYYSIVMYNGNRVMMHQYVDSYVSNVYTDYSGQIICV